VGQWASAVCGCAQSVGVPKGRKFRKFAVPNPGCGPGQYQYEYKRVRVKEVHQLSIKLMRRCPLWVTSTDIRDTKNTGGIQVHSSLYMYLSNSQYTIRVMDRHGEILSYVLLQTANPYAGAPAGICSWNSQNDSILNAILINHIKTICSWGSYEVDVLNFGSNRLP
jgi:hypothetical protein